MRSRADARLRAPALVGVALSALTALSAGAAQLPDIGLPAEAAQTFAQDVAFDRYAAPVGVFGRDPWLKPVTGAVSRRAHRLPEGADSLQVARAIEAALSSAGFETRLRCDQAECGGLAFRSGLWLAPFPHMRVSIGDYHQLTMQRGDDLFSVLVSRAGDAVYVQSVSVDDARTDPVVETPTTLPPSAAPTSAQAPPPGGDVGAALDALGYAVLETVDFEPGSLNFLPGSEQGLDGAAEALRARPGLAVAVVGHTDGVGGLPANRRVGELRAQAVLDALVGRGVDAARLEAHSAAWLAPRASNDNAQGRARNRRVTLVARSDP